MRCNATSEHISRLRVEILIDTYTQTVFQCPMKGMTLSVFQDLLRVIHINFEELFLLKLRFLQIHKLKNEYITVIQTPANISNTEYAIKDHFIKKKLKFQLNPSKLVNHTFFNLFLIWLLCWQDHQICWMYNLDGEPFSHLIMTS